MSVNVNVLQLAFTYGAILRIIGSDRVLEVGELTFLQKAFPDSLLASCGFLDANGRLSDTFDRALDEAHESLPGLLTRGQKLALMESLVEAAASDGVLAAEEADQLHGVARELGLGDEAWTEHLQALIREGRVRRDDAGV